MQHFIHFKYIIQFRFKLKLKFYKKITIEVGSHFSNENLKKSCG